MNEKEVIALYCINKYAKQIRDDVYAGRKMLKERLFDIYNFDDAKKFPERFGIDVSLDYLEDDICDKTNKELEHRLHFELDDEYRQCVWDACSFEELEFNIEEIDKLIKGDWIKLISNDKEEYDRIISVLKENCCNEVVENFEYYAGEYKEIKLKIEKIIEHNDQLHEFLHDGFEKYYNQMHYLYDLKSLTIKNSGTEPVSYHKMKGYNNILGVYKIGNFTFHLVVDDEDIELNEFEELETIDATIKIEADKVISYEESIKFLCDFNNLSSEIYEIIISGSFYNENLIYPNKPELDRECSSNDYYDYEDYEYEGDYEYFY